MLKCMHTDTHKYSLIAELTIQYTHKGPNSVWPWALKTHHRNRMQTHLPSSHIMGNCLRAQSGSGNLAHFRSAQKGKRSQAWGL